MEKTYISVVTNIPARTEKHKNRKTIITRHHVEGSGSNTEEYKQHATSKDPGSSDEYQQPRHIEGAQGINQV